MVIGILWKDKLAVKMFVDFYRSIYLDRGKPLTIAPSFYNSADIVSAQIAAAKEASKGMLFILMEIPATLPFDKAPASMYESCDMLLGLSRDLVADPVKVVSEEQLAIVARWASNVQRLAAH